MEEKKGIKNFEATHSGGDRAEAEEACYTANSAIASTKDRQRQNADHPLCDRLSTLI
ncbi:MAG: hypothetical protein ICV54_25570 [Nostoc sp. C3-bin3]|nr:hypothetical protein [Nostoc sp. C3-bin3]